MNLSNSNKIRHSYAIRGLLTEAVSRNQGIRVLNQAGKPTNSVIQSWPYGEIGKRMGSRRSADGFVFDLPQCIAPDRSKVVVKVIFSDDTGPESEISIGVLMGEEKIGPKIYSAYRVSAPRGRGIYNSMNRSGTLLNFNGRRVVNLFQGFNHRNANRRGFRYIYLIIMENLYNNPSKFVEGAKDLTAAQIDPRYHIPYAKIMKLRRKMQRLGVIHVDLHTGNLIIQKIKRPSGRVYFNPVIIDFGRSIRFPRQFHSNQNVNNFIRTELHGTVPTNAHNLAYANTHLKTRNYGLIGKNTAVTNNLERIARARRNARRTGSYGFVGGSASSNRSAMRTRTPNQTPLTPMNMN